MGIESSLQANTSIALGTSEVTPLELTAAYVPFANGGYRPEVHFINRVTTVDGDVLYENPRDRFPRVLNPEVVGMMNAMMMQTVSTGTAKKAAFAWPSAGKTGTSQNSRDAWFIGYTANLTTGVWFGNDDGKAMKKVTGGALPAQAWHEFMVAAHEGVPVARLPGTWSSGDGGIEVRVPSVDVGEGDPIAAAEERLKSLDEKPRPAKAVTAREKVAPPPAKVAVSETKAVGRDVVRPKAEVDQTSSIRRPSADVGGGTVKRETSLLDVLLGN
jgi:penicillin-binding protein 1A